MLGNRWGAVRLAALLPLGAAAQTTAPGTKQDTPPAQPSGMAPEKALEAVLGDFGEREIRSCGLEVAERLLELLVDFRGIDDSKELACLHAGSNVDIPLFQIPGGARKDR